MSSSAIALGVRDLEVSLKFYREIFGFQEWFRWEDTPGHLAAGAVQYGDMRIIFDPVDPGAAEVPHLGTGVTLYLDVSGSDIDAICEQVSRRTRVLSPIEDKPWGDRVFTVADPDGYRISFARTGA